MRHLAVAVLVVFVVSCDKLPAAPTGSADVRVTGRILDYASGAGVSGARVAFEDLGTDNRYVVVATALSDVTGAYTLMVPSGDHQPFVDGEWIGQLRLTGLSYWGDLLVRGGNCVARYGTVTDAQTLRPIAGVTVSVRGPGLEHSTVSGTDGWYRIDLGCPSGGVIGFNTTEILASHPNYGNASKPTGRGVAGVTRVDFELGRR
jgi:hypothetical protein